MEHRANIWAIEFVIALAIFSAVLFLVYSYNQEIFSLAVPKSEVIIKDATRLSDALVTPGIPVNWPDLPSFELVQNIGITEDDFSAINETKLLWIQDFVGVGESFDFDKYEQLKGLLGVDADFIFFFEDNNLEMIDFNMTNGTMGRFFGDMRLGSRSTYIETDTANEVITSNDQINNTVLLNDRLIGNGVHHIIKAYRFLFFDRKVLRMGVYVWKR
jgi:hypothetical protein